METPSTQYCNVDYGVSLCLAVPIWTDKKGCGLLEMTEDETRMQASLGVAELRQLAAAATAIADELEDK